MTFAPFTERDKETLRDGITATLKAAYAVQSKGHCKGAFVKAKSDVRVNANGEKQYDHCASGSIQEVVNSRGMQAIWPRMEEFARTRSSGPGIDWPKTLREGASRCLMIVIKEKWGEPTIKPEDVVSVKMSRIFQWNDAEERDMNDVLWAFEEALTKVDYVVDQYAEFFAETATQLSVQLDELVKSNYFQISGNHFFQIAYQSQIANQSQYQVDVWQDKN
jgi:hypothetical protein